MGDDLTADERKLCRKLRALTLREAELNLAWSEALIERDQFMIELDSAKKFGPLRLAEVMHLNWSRIYQIRNAWASREARWKAKRPKLVARIKALKSDSQ